MKLYKIWFRYLNDKQVTAWKESRHSVRARTDKEADSRMARMFRNAGFHSMGLAAVPVHFREPETMSAWLKGSQITL